MGINRYENGSWKEINDLQCLRNGEWQTAELRRYDGTEWEQLWPCHFTLTKQYPLSAFIVTSRRSSPQQVSSDYLVTGASSTASTNYVHDSLLFFPMDEMAADLTGADILKASLQLKRLPKQDDDGQNTASITIGCALSGADPSATNNTWSREYTDLIGSTVNFNRGQTKDVAIDTAGVTALLSGNADCLCLPTGTLQTYNTQGYAFFDPAATILTVTYFI